MQYSEGFPRTRPYLNSQTLRSPEQPFKSKGSNPAELPGHQQTWPHCELSKCSGTMVRGNYFVGLILPTRPREKK